MYKNGFASVVLLLLIVILVAGFVFFRQKQESMTLVNSDNNNVVASVKPTADNLLTLQQFDTFTFQYPSYFPNWITDEHSEIPHIYIDYLSPSTGGGAGHDSDFRLGVVGPYPNSDLDLSMWVKKNYPSIQGAYGSGPLETVTTVAVVNSIETIQQKHIDKGTTVPASYAVFFSVKNKIYQIYFNNQITNVSNLDTYSKQFDQLFQQILSSLKDKN